MTRGSRPKYAPGYDLFKLIVAAILTIILVALLLLDRQQRPALPGLTVMPAGATETLTSLLPTVTEMIRPATIAAQSLSTPIPPTVTPLPFPTSTPTTSPLGAPLPASTEVIQPDANTCPSASSRIRIGDNLRVLTRLNFRTGPGLNWPIILTNNPGTIMQVIGGPICTRLNASEGLRAYLWWNVRTQNDQEGWSVEASLISPHYFLAPIR
jgi:hypothetical protein